MVDIIVQISLQGNAIDSGGKGTKSGVQVTQAEDVVYVAHLNTPIMTHHDCRIRSSQSSF